VWFQQLGLRCSARTQFATVGVDLSADAIAANPFHVGWHDCEFRPQGRRRYERDSRRQAARCLDRRAGRFRDVPAVAASESEPAAPTQFKPPFQLNVRSGSRAARGRRAEVEGAAARGQRPVVAMPLIPVDFGQTSLMLLFVAILLMTSKAANARCFPARAGRVVLAGVMPKSSFAGLRRDAAPAPTRDVTASLRTSMNELTKLAPNIAELAQRAEAHHKVSSGFFFAAQRARR
jgi:hypothetical protein